MCDVLRRLRARADKGHLARDDVHELRELVELQPSEQCANARDAKVDTSR